VPIQAILLYIKVFVYFYIKPESLKAAFYNAGGRVFDMPDLECPENYSQNIDSLRPHADTLSAFSNFK
jgi:hypothetical protein